jgi:pilus assembly protein Flp/PilA
MGRRRSSSFDDDPGDLIMLLRTLKSLRNFLESEDGPTAVEYAVMLALIIMVCITAVTGIGTNSKATYQKVTTTLQTANS